MKINYKPWHTIKMDDKPDDDSANHKNNPWLDTIHDQPALVTITLKTAPMPGAPKGTTSSNVYWKSFFFNSSLWIHSMVTDL